MAAPNLRFTSEITDNFDYIHVKDITDYATHRDDYGLAMFVSKGIIGQATVLDPSLCDLSNPGTETDPAEWYIECLPGYRYDIVIFLVPIWVAGAYVVDKIVYHVDDETFYICGVNTSDEPPDSDWTEITMDAVGLAHLWDGVDKNDYQYEEISEDVFGGRFTITQTGCHTYTVTDNWSLGFTYQVTDYSGVTEIEVGETTGYTLALTFEEDGVYILNLDVDESNPETLVIYDFCDLNTCLKTLIRRILCKCDDPCTPPCDNALIKQLQRHRDTINQILALYYPLISLVQLERYKYVGIYTMDETREQYITDVAEKLIALGRIVTSCGACTDDIDIDETLTNCQ